MEPLCVECFNVLFEFEGSQKELTISASTVLSYIEDELKNRGIYEPKILLSARCDVEGRESFYYRSGVISGEHI